MTPVALRPHSAQQVRWAHGGAPPWWARAMPPLWQYFSRLQKKADESIAAPKSADADPELFPASGLF
jgi:hypothetical protein